MSEQIQSEPEVQEKEEKQSEDQVEASSEPHEEKTAQESGSAPEATEPQTKKSEELTFELERDYVVPLRHVYWTGRSKRAKRAMNLLKKFVAKHMKSEDIVVDSAVNHVIWSRSIEKPPRRISIHVGRTKENKVYVYLKTGSESA
ncbi:MAG: 50S ribosomal protein L31e [Thermoprotei archaeon]